MNKTFEDYIKDKKILEEAILRLLNQFEQKYPIYFKEIDIATNVSRSTTGYLKYETVQIVIKANL